MQRLAQTDFWVGTIRVQPQLGTLTVNEQTHHLEPRQMSVLVCLAERPGEVVAKEKLLEIVWDGMFVSEQVLKVAISELRKALADSAREPRFIQTVPKQGYRLIAPVLLAGDKQKSISIPPHALIANLIAPKKRINWIALTATALVGLLGALLVWKIIMARPVAATPEAIRAIAVLPLKNMSGDAAEDYFADGLTEALISDFARTTQLKVISRTSVIKYKEVTKTIPQIAAELNVGAVIEGSVLRSGDRVRVNVRLIDAASDRHIWAQKYEGETKDILTLQSEIASAIAHQIEAQFDRTTTQEQSVAVNLEAYDAYLKGRFFWNKGGEDNLLRSVTYYEQAVQLEPRFARALAGLADAHNFLAFFGFNKPSEHFSKARQAARSATTISPDLAESHAALAFNLMYADWNWAEAEKEFRLALDLEPGRAVTHHWAASLYALLNRHEEALAEAHQAHTLDPLSPNVNSDLAWYYYYARRFDEAIRLCRRTLELDPASTSMEVCLQLCYQYTGQPENAVAELTEALKRQQRPAPEIEQLRRAFAGGGLPGLWHQYLKTLERLARVEPPRFYLLVLGYAVLGETERAIYWLEQAVENHLGWVPFIGVDPGLDGLRKDGRFQTLLRRLGVQNQGVPVD